MKNIGFLIISLFHLLHVGRSGESGTPWIPEPASQQPWMDMFGWNWMERHQGFVENSRENGSKINILFLGDSLTDFYSDQGAAVWNQVWEPLGGVNYGIGGDRTEHVLWRIMNGEIDGIEPKVVVLMIGVNNIWCEKTDQEIARGITTIVKHLRKALPSTKILLLGNAPANPNLFGPETSGFDVTQIVGRINSYTSKLDDIVKDFEFVDVSDVFYDGRKGELKKQKFVSDILHFSEDGYIGIYEKMWPVVRMLLGNDAEDLPSEPIKIKKLNPVDLMAGMGEEIKKVMAKAFDVKKMCVSTLSKERDEF